MSSESPPFGRVLTAMVTPFGADGSLDSEQAGRLARHLVENGSEGLVITGTTGESPTLSTGEKVRLYEAVSEAVGDRAMVVAGTGTYDTAGSVKLSRMAAQAGCGGVMAVTPYYNKPTQGGLVAHFEAIADATELPLLVYNIPSRTSRLIEIETLARLAEHPNIVATKDAVMDLDFTSGTVGAAPGLTIYSGQDSYTLPMMSVGAVGVVSVISHLAGPTVAQMVHAAVAGDYRKAAALHHALIPLGMACFMETNPGPVKAALGESWGPVGGPRLPLVAPSEQTLRAVREALAGLSQG
ncbi:MAG: 4-hydroxy-tetrahydrodipicolinate synthase [bacterium]|nr:4-hydroxy-tetrahydrodipicolinate synthase [bacterium]